MWNSLKSLYNDFSDKLDPNGSLEVDFKEPEYPYFFEFYPERLSPIKRLKLEGMSNYGNGKMLIRTNKSGKPIIVNALITARGTFSTMDIDVLRNDLDFPMEVLMGFARLCISRAMAEKTDGHLTEKDSAGFYWMQYENRRRKMKEIWNNYMENADE